MSNQSVRNLTMQQKRGTSTALAAVNPVLLAGEVVFVTDLNKFKVGDGTTAFNSLPFLKVSPTDIIGLLDQNGKFDTSFLPSLSIGDTVIVATEAEKLELTTAEVQKGDVVIVTGSSKTYFVIDDTKLNLEAGYAQILTPAAPVQSVNTKTGNVTLDTDDISEGESNLYYTDARAVAAAKTVNSTELADGATVLHTSDTITIDAGEITAPVQEQEPGGE